MRSWGRTGREKSLNDYLQENIFAPLEMNSTTATPLDTPARVAISYERWYGVLARTNVQLPLFQRRRVGGGGLYSTAGDLSNFLLAQMALNFKRQKNLGQLAEVGFFTAKKKIARNLHGDGAATLPFLTGTD